jgi:hypothetical protein
MIMPYDPRKPYLSGEQYIHDPGYLAPELAERVGRDVRTLCRALGYDLNTVEFAIKDGIPSAIDFMNPAPDAELASVGEFYHNWVTKAVTDLVFRRLSEPQPAGRYRWDAMLNPTPAASAVAQPLAAVATAAQSAADAILPQSVRDLPSDLAGTVTDFLGHAAGVVSGLVGSVTDAVTPDAKSETEAQTGTTTPAPKGATKSTRTASSSSKKGATKRPASTRSRKTTTATDPTSTES